MNLASLFAFNRQRVAAALPPGSLAIFHVTPTDNSVPFDYLTESPFGNDLYWLTGLQQVRAYLLLLPQHPDEHLREILFISTDEATNKLQIDHDTVSLNTGITNIRGYHEFQETVAQTVSFVSRIYLNQSSFLETGANDLPRWLKRQLPWQEYEFTDPVLARLQLTPSEAEVDLIRAAVNISQAGYHRVLACVRSSMTPRQLEAELLHVYWQYEGASWTMRTPATPLTTLRELIGRRSGYSEPGPAGELALLNAPASYYGYAGALTRTIPVSGHYSPRQRQVYEAVVRVQQALTNFIAVGKSYPAIRQYYVELLVAELLQLGVGSPEALQQQGAEYHIDQHCRPDQEWLTDLGGRSLSGFPNPLPAGTVLVTDIGIDLPVENIGVRLVNTLRVLPEGTENLTASIPSEASDLETLINQPSSLPPAQPALERVSVPSQLSQSSFRSPSLQPKRKSRWSQLLRYSYLLLLPLLLLDLGYSYVQHINVPHDGDMTAVVLPRAYMQPVLDDAFGLGALLRGELSIGPNRHFAHLALYTYLRNVPLALQHFTNPINSIYMACAIAKTLIQAGLIFILSFYISNTAKPISKAFLFAAIIITPFFQTAGYHDQMAIIDRSITYTIFYALPLAGLLVYFLPFYKLLFTDSHTPITIEWNFALPVLAVILALSGPLIPAAASMMSGSVLLYLCWKSFSSSPEIPFITRTKVAISSIPKAVLWQLTFFVFCCLYSLYIGTFNLENVDTISLTERYSKLGQGFWIELGQRAGFPLLLLCVIINLFIIRSMPRNKQTGRIIKAAQWLLILSALYILLLPLGGYREYRPYIIRRDSIMPVTLSLLYLIGTSTLYLINSIQARFKRVYLAALVGVIGFYSYTDQSNLKENNCEVDALRTIADSPEKIVHLESNCSVMNWGLMTDPNNSVEQAKMLHYWRITKEEKLYYQ
ncbi:M24 family metallopeptidase [Hymenobacter sp. B81]|uniref:M24 family metallopeptidase n=1 Tax=Hymenobacter sp. B81 TaxID=3344878 RepID=UPI0037DD043A